MGLSETQNSQGNFPRSYGGGSDIKNHQIVRYLTRYLDGCTLSEFPSLSGLRREAHSDAFVQTSFVGRASYGDLESAAGELDFLPVAALQAAWASLLCAYSGPERRDVAFEAEMPDGISYTAAANTSWATVPIRVTTEGRRSSVSCLDIVRELSQHLKLVTSATMENLVTPIREVGDKPYDSLLAFQSRGRQPSSSTYGQELLKRARIAVVVVVSITEAGYLHYTALSTNKYLSKDAAAIMLRQLDEVLQSITIAPRMAYGELFENVSQPLKSLSNHKPDGANPLLHLPILHGQFEEHAASNPDDEALVHVVHSKENQMYSRKWTYGTLNTEAACLAQRLVVMVGDLKGRVVPILMAKEPLLYITILAILKAGGAWCPIDPLSPFARRCDLIARTQSAFVIVNDTFLEDPLNERLPGTRMICPEDFKFQEVEAAHDLQFSSRGRSISGTDPAYVIWTSGTTGPPKGVVVSHEAASASMTALQALVPRGKDGKSVRCMQFSQHTFDVFVQDLFYTWGLGGTVISASRALMANSFAQVSLHAFATHAHLTPAFAATLPRSTCPTIEVVTMIGESLPQHVADDWATDVSAFNTYGPAEAAVVATVCQLHGKGRNLRSSNIGKPLPSLWCYVLQDGKFAPRNAVGELALGGPQLAQGYLNDPEKTSQKFVWNEEIHQRLYLTGDLVRMLADNSLEFLGRQDDLVKLQGIRVELSEISFALRGCHDSVRQIETCFLSRRDRPVKVVVTFLSLERSCFEASNPTVVTNGFAREVAASVQTAARQALPDVMIPASVIVINYIPRTTSAKTDVKTLQGLYESIDIGRWESDLHSEILRDGHHHAWTAIDLEVLDAVCSVCKIPLEAIDYSTYLPAIGLDSIAAAKLATVLDAKEISLDYGDILKCRHVDDLLRSVGNSPKNAYGVQQRSLENIFDKLLKEKVQDFLKTDINGVLPVTSLQESLLAEVLETAPAYWSNRCYTLPSTVDIDQLKSAWQGVCNDTEALRTSFLVTAELELPAADITRGDTFLQAIYDHWDLAWSVVDLKEQEWLQFCREKAKSIAYEHHNNAFRTPPWAVTIIRSPRKDESQMMITLHHALHDEVASDAIVEDVWNAYRGLRSSEMRRQLSEVVLCLTSAAKEPIDETTAFWKRQLEEYAAFSDAELPKLHSSHDPCQASSEGAMVSRHMEIGTSDVDLQHAARSLGISIAAVFRAAWSYVVLRYLDVPRAIIGETVSERIYHPHLKDAIAPMLSVVPVAVRSSQTAMSLFQDQESSACLFRNNRKVTTATLRKLLGRPKPQPLYPAVFNFLYDSPPSHCPWTETRDSTDVYVEHPLALTVYKSISDSKWCLELFGNPAFVDGEHLQLICNQTSILMQAMIEYPNEPIAKLLNHAGSDAISVSESHLCGSMHADSLANATFWASELADNHPTWTAVEIAHKLTGDGTRTRSWSFKTLDEESNKIAAFISKCGHRSRRIAMCASRSLISYAVILGIFKSGNTYLPIDESLPDERKSFLLNDSGSPMIFTDASAKASMPVWPEQCSAIDLDSEDTVHLLNTFSGAKRMIIGDLDEDAYLLYTSGSTGLPKGVLISHRNLCGFVEGLASFLHQCSPITHSFGGRGKFLGLASRAFDVHLCEMFLGWRLGLCAVTAPRELLLDSLLTALVELRVTHACFVPTLLDQSGIKPHQVPNLVYFSVGGEKLSQNVVDVWGKQDRTLVINAYGPTEVAIGCCASRVVSNSTTRNIGKPFGNTTAHILLPGTTDYALRGQSGELCITGDLVGNGYLQRPDLEAFVDDFNGTRMYRTGDIVRMMSNGSMEYLGRDDDQIKIRGQRIELGEVSECIKKSLSTDIDVVTLVLQHPKRRNAQLISFIAPIAERQQRYGANPVCKKSNSWISTGVRAACRNYLPDYMVPDFVVPTSVIPLVLTSGKADVKLLKQLFFSLSSSELLKIAKATCEENDSSRNLTNDEIVVKDVLRHILRVDENAITYNTNLFGLGLDSLTAITLSVKLKKAGFEGNLKDILSSPTVEKLASLTRTDRERAERNAAEHGYSKPLDDFDFRARATQASDLVTVEAIRPCLPLQEALIATSLGGARETVYVNHILLKLRNPAETDRILQAWFAVIKKTQILRTCFRQMDNHFAQFVLSPATITPDLFLLFSLEQEDSRPSALENFRSRAARSIIDRIEVIPPLRMGVIEFDVGSFLSISIHHALYDAVSFNSVMNDVSDSYLGLPLSPKTSFDALLNQVVTQKESDQETFWTQYLSGASKSCFLIHSEEAEDISLERKLSLEFSSLRMLASSLNATVSILSQACFGAVISRLLQQKDIVLGVILSGRTVSLPQPENIVAPCLTTIPQRINFEPGRSLLAEVIQDVQERFAECLEYQHTSLRNIQRWVGATQPLFDCLFQYLGEIEQTPRYLELWSWESSTMPLDYPIALELEPDSQADTVTARISCKLTPDSPYDPASILDQMDNLIQALNQNKDLSIEVIGVGKESFIRQALKAPTFDEMVYTPQESILREIVAEMCDLELSTVKKSASFFQLGIDSVTVIPFSRRLRQAGMNVLPSEVMKYACIGSLYKHLKDKSESQGGLQAEGYRITTTESSKVPVQEITLLNNDDVIQATYPCTPLQAGMLSASLASSKVLYFHHHIVRLKPDVEVAKLGPAWQQIVRKNDILRSSFHFFESFQNPWIGGVHSSIPSNGLNVTKVETLRAFTKTIEGRNGFNTKEGFGVPPSFANIVEVARQQFFILSMHHAFYDGMSIPMIFHDLYEAYHSRSLQERPSFQETAALIHQRSSTSVDFWLKSVKGFRPAQLSSKHVQAEDKAIYLEMKSRLDLTDLLRGAQFLGVTLQSIALLAYGKLLARVYGQRDVVFGHVVSGRSLPLEGCESIIGPLFNTVPLRIKLLDLLQTNKDFLGHLQHFLGRSLDYQHASLQSIQQAWRRESKPVDTSLIRALFVFQRADDNIGINNNLWEPFELEFEIAPEYPLSFEFEQASEEILLRASCLHSFGSEEELSTMIRNFEDTIKDIISYPAQTILEFPVGLSNLPLTRPLTADTVLDKNSEGKENNVEITKLRKILSDLSGVPPEIVSDTMSIFALGIDSIQAIKLASICKRNGINVGVGGILLGQTILGILQRRDGDAMQIQGSGENNVNLKLSQVEASWLPGSGVEAILHCLGGQNYHLAKPFLTSSGESYPTFFYTTNTHLDHQKLQQAWHDLITLTPSLRTVFAATLDGGCAQIILKASTFESDDFGVLETDVGDNEATIIERYLAYLEQETFDSRAPPHQLRLLKSTREVLALTLHHVIYDAWTVQLLIADLQKLYNDYELDPRPDYVKFIQHTFHQRRRHDSKGYWRNALRNSSTTLIKPSSSPSPSSSSRQQLGTTFVSLPTTLSGLQSLQTICKAHSLSFSSMLLLAFSRLLAFTTKNPDPVFGHFILGRSSAFPDIDQLAGPCMNVLPFLARDALTTDPVAAAKKIQEDLASRVPYEQDSLGDVLKWIQGDKDEGKSSGSAATDDHKGADDIQPLFNAYLNILPSPPPASKSEALSSNLDHSQDEGEELILTPLPVPPNLARASAASSTPGNTPSKAEVNTQALAPTEVDNGNGDDDEKDEYLEMGEATLHPMPKPQPPWPLAAQALYVDIALSADGERADIAAKSEGGLMDEEEMRRWLDRLVGEVEKLRRALESGVEGEE